MDGLRGIPLLILLLGMQAPTVRGQESILTADGSPVALLADSEPAKMFENPYAGSLLTRQRLLGDVGGARANLADNGITFDLFHTQFYQGVVEGGRQQAGEYGGKVDYLFNLDGGKLGPWKGGFINIHAETRYGSDVNSIDGLLAPANIPMSFPEAEVGITSITAFKVTQALSESFAIFGGKINTLDEYPIRYSPGYGDNKPGLAGFMNTSLVFNPILARTVPYAAAGVGFALLNEGEPFFSLIVLDPEERAASGMQNLYERGVTIAPDLTLRLNPFNRPGLYNLGATYSNANYVSVEPSAYLNEVLLQTISLEEANLPTESESWAVYFNFYQSLWVDEDHRERTWGIFGQFGVSDGNPNPIRRVLNGGVGGRSMLPGRDLDTFGVGYFLLELSDEFKQLTAPLIPQRNEQGVEVFYNLAITPAVRLTGDVQIARPSTSAFNTTVIPGLRLQMLY